MTHEDAYDPRVAFDDYIVGGATPAYDVLGSAQAIARRATRRRLRAPMDVLGSLGYDPTSKTFAVPEVVLGAEPEPKPTGLPVFDALHQRFRDALPGPKMVRVDDDGSYERWKETRREPYVAQLEERLTALEEAVRAHVADHHGGGRLAALESAFERHVSDPDAHNRALDAVIGQVALCGTRVPLHLPEEGTGAILCWRDGDELLCSVRLPSREGVRIATTAVPVKHAVDETLGAAVAEEVHPEAILLVVPTMAPVLGGMGLLGELCRAAPTLAGVGTPFVGVLASPTDPKLAAAMALVQRCQRGDPAACAEAGILKKAERRLMKDAEKRLKRAQRERARAS